MSTITKIVDRPSDAPKTPIYPRLLRLAHNPEVVVWAISPNYNARNSFNGVILASGNSASHTVGSYSEDWAINLWEDFTGAITLYNK